MHICHDTQLFVAYFWCPFYWFWNDSTTMLNFSCDCKQTHVRRTYEKQMWLKGLMKDFLSTCQWHVLFFEQFLSHVLVFCEPSFHQEWKLNLLRKYAHLTWTALAFCKGMWRNQMKQNGMCLNVYAHTRHTTFIRKIPIFPLAVCIVLKNSYYGFGKVNFSFSNNH